MTWTLKKDSLFTKEAKEIGYFLPTANEKERTMIENGDDLVDLVGELVTDYDEGKTPLKSVYNRLSKIIDIHSNYNLDGQKLRRENCLMKKNK